MKAHYDPSVDMLSIALCPHYRAGGAEDTGDPDVVLHYDAERRLAEIEVSHASARVDLRALRSSPAFEVETAADVQAVRARTGLSQRAFADWLGVSPRTLQNWEQGHRTPAGPARRLLELALREPQITRDPQGTQSLSTQEAPR